MKSIRAIAVIMALGTLALFVIFILVGFFFVSDESLKAIEGLWIAAISGVVGVVLIGLFLALGRLAILAYKDSLILPDENGNFPISLTGKNYNLAGVPLQLQPKAWLGWQLTNNRGASLPSAAFGQLTQEMPEYEPPLQLPAEVLNPHDAPPILLDARDRAMEM